VSERRNKRFTDVLLDIRGGDVIAELTDQLREVVQRVRDTGRPGSISLTLKVKNASKGAGAALLIEDDIKVKLPVAEKGTTILFATDEGELQRNDPRQPRLTGMDKPATVVPMTPAATPASQEVAQ
jgi:hypothetical protein